MAFVPLRILVLQVQEIDGVKCYDEDVGFGGDGTWFQIFPLLFALLSSPIYLLSTRFLPVSL
jgi:hypothetical protein